MPTYKHENGQRIFAFELTCKESFFIQILFIGNQLRKKQEECAKMQDLCEGFDCDCDCYWGKTKSNPTSLLPVLGV